MPSVHDRRPCHGSRLALALVMSSLVGCATTRPPVRSPWTGVDTVDAVDSDAFVGDWRLTVLNPYEGQELAPTTIRYDADGTFHSEIMPNGEGAEAIGSDRLVMSGRWSVGHGLLRHADLEMSSPGGSVIAQIIADMINENRKDIAGTADVYELSAERIVTVGTEDGVANALERQ